jgi:UDP-glucose 4-epimerase
LQDLLTASQNDLRKAMTGAHCLIHLAAVVPGKNAISEINATVEIARIIAAAAANAKIDRVIVMSSVYAELAERENPKARRYGYEKLAADEIFASYLPKPSLIFLRPPVVYGSAMRGSMQILVKLISKGVWLPLGLARNERSYISITNLVNLLQHLAALDDTRWQAAQGQRYVPTDGAPVSTVELINTIAASLGVEPKLIPCPPSALRLIGWLVGQSGTVSGAFDSLPFNDNYRLLKDFRWSPVEAFPQSHAIWQR